MSHAGSGPFVMSIDGGTESLRVGVFDLQGRLLATAAQTYGTSFPRPGWAEQDPNDWWVAAANAVRQATGWLSGVEIAGIGLSGQMKGLVSVDGAGRPVRRCIVYTDARSTSEAFASLMAALPCWISSAMRRSAPFFCSALNTRRTADAFFAASAIPLM